MSGFAIAALAAPGGGTIGISRAPGAKGALEAEIGAIADWGAALVLTLIGEAEFRAIGVEALPEALVARGIAWRHAPVEDWTAPDEPWMARWRDLAPELHLRLTRDERVLVHCRGGLGRSGTVAARLLAERGMAPEAAIRTVRAARPGAIETPDQEAHVRAVAPALGFADRARGCLLGGAMGDALGAGVELLSRAAILSRFGPKGPRDPLPGASFTDDTQLTLFTAEGLLRAARRGTDRGTEVGEAYRRWFGTQHGRAEAGLAAVPALLTRRGPGPTCLAALAAGRFPAENDSASCGAVMRAAPCGIVAAPEEAFALGATTGRLTHGHPNGYLPAGVLAALVSALLRGATLPAALATARALLAAAPGAQGTRAALDAALSAARDGFDADRLESLGTGRSGQEALSIALYAVLTADTPEDVLVHAVAHGGDSDSTGSIAGNLVGAMVGAAFLPVRWRAGLELGELIETMAADLAGAA